MLGRNAFRVIAGALVLGAVIHVATSWPRVGALAGTLEAGSWLVVAGFVVAALTALAACALAALLVWKAAERPDARALALFLAFLAIFWGSLFRFLDVDAAARTFEVNLRYGSDWTSQSALAAFVLMFAALLRFSALFPRPLTADRLPAPRLERMRPARAARRVRVAFLGPGVVWGSAVVVYLVQRFVPGAVMSVVDMSEAAEGRIPSVVLLAFLGAIVLMALYAVLAVATGVRNLISSYRLAAGDERRRIQWVIAGFVAAWWLTLAGAGLVAVSAALGGADAAGGVVAVWDPAMLGVALPLALFIAPLVVVAGAAVGILYAGAIDPALALHKSTIYGALGALGVIGFAALESVLAELLEARVPLPGLVGPVTAGVVVAAVLLPLRGLLRRWTPDPGSTDGGSADEGGPGPPFRHPQ